MNNPITRALQCFFVFTDCKYKYVMHEVNKIKL